MNICSNHTTEIEPNGANLSSICTAASSAGATINGFGFAAGAKAYMAPIGNE